MSNTQKFTADRPEWKINTVWLTEITLQTRLSEFFCAFIEEA